jgi:MFS family permease
LAEALIQRKSNLSLFLISVFWFAINFHWSALLIIVIPSQLLNYIADANKGRYLGLLLGIGAVVVLISQPLFGAISDRAAFRIGRRRPFILIGVLGNIIGLLIMYLARSFSSFLIGFLCVQLMNNIATAPYQALMPDLVPYNQRGSASGYMGLMLILSQVAAFGTVGLLVSAGHLLLTYLIIAVLLFVLMMITIIFVKEFPIEKPEKFIFMDFVKSFWVSPRKYPDFAWVFLTRIFIMLGIYTLQDFFAYFIKDVIGFENFEQVTGITLMIMSIFSVISVFAAGYYSDRFGRKKIVYAAGAIMAMSAAIFIFTGSYFMVIVLGILFGFGFGAYTSVDWALATDVLPPTNSYAKDMGIWNMASVLPQIIAPVVAGPILDYFNMFRSNFGYSSVFATVVIYFILGTVLLRFVRKVR